jgi:hypothetical protein
LNLTDRRGLRAALIIALLLHAAFLIWARYWLQTPSLLEKLPPSFYTRVLYPQAAPAPRRPAPRKPRVTARRIKPALVAVASTVAASEPAVQDSAPVASAPEPEASATDAEPESAASEPAAPASDASETAPVGTPEAAGDDASTAAPDTAASAPSNAPPLTFFDTWPSDTRLTYTLTGNYRGPLHGKAKVLWQRLLDGQQTRYQTDMQLDLGLLLSMRLTSQGQITEQGLAPQVYEEQIGQRRRHASIGEDIQLNNGKRAPRPDGVQDTASQLIELAHRLATAQTPPVPGDSVHLWLARPAGVSEWVYDLLGEETIELPRLGAVPAIHLKPRRLNDASSDTNSGTNSDTNSDTNSATNSNANSNAIHAEIWLAPSLQYLPVRILLTRGADTSVDLLVDAIEQK